MLEVNINVKTFLKLFLDIFVYKSVAIEGHSLGLLYGVMSVAASLGDTIK